jgi:Protein of unknown function (DUF2752)
VAGSASGSRDAPLFGVRAPALELAAAGLCLACAGAVAVGAVAGNDAAVGPDGPVLCPFRLLTGLPCPFCGMTRSLLALGRGDVAASVALHPLGPAVALLAVLGLWRFVRPAVRRRGGGVPARLPRSAPLAVAAAFAVAWVLTLSHGPL